MSYGLVLTNAGAAEIETAYQAGETVSIVQVALGDGGGKALPVTPAKIAEFTQLAGQFGSEPFSGGETDEGMISGRVVIPCATYPGKTLREVGLISASGTLIAYGIYPETYIPDEGSAVLKEITLTLVMALTHAESVSIEVDPHTAVMTMDAGDARYLQQQRNLADLDDFSKALKNLGAYPMSGGYLNEDASATVISKVPGPLPSGATIYSPMWRAAIQGRGGDVDFTDGGSACFRAVEVVNNYAFAEILFDGYGGARSFQFRNDGSFRAPGLVSAGQGFIATDGNLYGPAWGGYLNQWVLAQINALNVALNNQISASINNNNSGWVLPNFQLKNTANLGGGWEKDSTTGRIRQWGYLNAGATTGFFQVNFPITFPNACANVQVTVVNGGGGKYADNFATAGNVTQSGFTCGQDTGGSYWEAIGW